jgi:hypothetical protein
LGEVAKVKVNEAVSYYSWNTKLLQQYVLQIELVPFLRLQIQSEVTKLGPSGKATLRLVVSV